MVWIYVVPLQKNIKYAKYMDTMLIELTEQKATGLLHELEGLRLIKIIRGNNNLFKTKLSDKYKGFLTYEEGQQLNNHISQMRSEWNNI
jgi:hypothetical protein